MRCSPSLNIYWYKTRFNEQWDVVLACTYTWYKTRFNEQWDVVLAWIYTWYKTRFNEQWDAVLAWIYTWYKTRFNEQWDAVLAWIYTDIRSWIKKPNTRVSLIGLGTFLFKKMSYMFVNKGLQLDCWFLVRYFPNRSITVSFFVLKCKNGFIYSLMMDC